MGRPRFLTVEQVAAREVLSVQRVRQLCARGQIKGASKDGRDWVISIVYQLERRPAGRPKKVVVAPKRLLVYGGAKKMGK